MKEINKLRKKAFLAYMWAAIAVILIAGSTYAWFTFSTTTNITPMAGTVGTGGAELLISNRYDGEYSNETELILESDTDELQPVSTADLDRFYQATAQNTSGISIRYKDVTDNINNLIMHGTLYLKSEYAACNVCFDREQLSFGNDVQALASMRLGLKITNHNGTDYHIFELEDFTNSYGAESTRTVDGDNVVVASINDKEPLYTSDPAENIIDYSADTGSAPDILPGNKTLLQIDENETATVEYFLYLEGCDDNCINSVQTNELELRLGFAGTKLD